MSKLVVLITSHVENGLQVAEAWHEAGAPGVTIIESQGLHRLQEKSRSLELPLFVSMTSVMRELEEGSDVILSIVDDDQVNTLIAAAGTVLGDLLQPDTGILFVLDVERVVGLRRTP